MIIKQLINAELDHLSTQELQEFYQLLKTRNNNKTRVNHFSDWDKLSQILDECQIETGIPDLAEQHDHYIHGTPKRQD